MRLNAARPDGDVNLSRQEEKTEWLRAGEFPQIKGVRNLIERSSDIVVLIDAAGLVSAVSVNPDCRSLGSLDHWIGQPFAQFLTLDSRSKFAKRLEKFRADPAKPVRPIELNHLDHAAWEFPIKYTIHPSDDHSVLLMGRDMEPLAEIQKRLVNEQMARERDQQRLRREETFYRVALEAAEAALVLVEPDQGRIRDLNSAAALLLGSKADSLSGNVFAQVFEGRRRGEFIEALHLQASAEETKPLEVTARRNDRVLHVTPEYFRAAGELFMLCRLQPVDGADLARPQIAHTLAALFTSTSDAIVLTDTKGVIRDANDAFLIMADAAQLRDVKDEPLSEFLVRGSIDLRLILETASTKERLRSYNAQFKSIVGTRANIDISAAALHPGAGEAGFGMIIREIAVSDLPEPEAVVSEDAMRNVMDLVGTASLKELVSATSDVVEKMCMETAIQLTGNNRMAAAEMLGLSRQSFYVKLRKHGLIKSDSEK